MAYDSMKVPQSLGSKGALCDSVGPKKESIGPALIGTTEKCRVGGPGAGPIEKKLDLNREQAQCLRQSLHDLKEKLRPILPPESPKDCGTGGPALGSSPLLGDLEDVSNIIANCQNIVGELMVAIEL